ncbi:oligopeptide transporter, OPT family [Mycobacterium ulcerans]|uniref:OPT family oligopeptide transporter n=1 Tax=Mycobacterium ulcerans TaxID=1809 RepID=UPI0012DDF458|nr:oligopeptide transporter, OPT family [Mycobacterium ulcerans]MEB3968138.1 oligopeptide transporter, OPT family [Mycobacterium ulcerans]MEB3976316.1 oligopeptide transporter, OPT family [Mycobacterium ulcerans]MEB4005661.1 oligopeptide transporter, OPT family [Mycobacterium ulcerans]MEB4415169.1 oligopeptide transporter, OPT family [Mycobacterium ulcerans]MEB4433392.1 oligopeptide transporter, OPT family [Mycobacterium ulcerans]
MSGALGSTREITTRGIILGGLITLVFTAANVYLGLKVGLTFATSIPAAVISMGVLRFFANHSIVENNIVQTIASAAGTLSAIIFVLPALIMIGWWSGFPYWTTVAVCGFGGLLGVMYSIPLRRALVTGSDLPYPEGVAGAEVLKIGASARGAEENRRGLSVIALGAVTAAGYSLLAALKVISNSLAVTFRLGSGATMAGASLSLALVGVGHLVGLGVGIAMIVGVLISYGVLLPMRTAGQLPQDGALADFVSRTFSSDVRFIGAGAIAVAAVWTFLKIAGPIMAGIAEAAVSARTRRRGEAVDLHERDIPIQLVGLVVLVSLIPIGLLLGDFTDHTPIAGRAGSIIAVSLLLIVTIGLVVASVCGYMAGLIGSSNSPISGVGILVVLLAALLIKWTYGPASDAQTPALVAYAVFTAAVIFGVATISNDNLQDLKTGQLVGATPWKQQVALVIGVTIGAAVIAPVLQLMQSAFGFQGAPGATGNALAAPQAALISALAKGVFGGSLNWSLVGLGALIGIVVVVVDEVLTRTTATLRLPPLAVGMGMYLPISLTLVIPVGAVLGRIYDSWAQRSGDEDESKRRMGVMLATGLIVGESLFGVAFAGIVVGTGTEDPLAILGDGFTHWAELLGLFVFAAMIALLYRYVRAAASYRPTTPGQEPEPLSGRAG